MAYSKGATVLYGRCDPDLELAFQPFAEALDIYVAQHGADRLNTRVETWAPDLSRIVPSLARRLPEPQRVTVDPETDRLRLFQAVTAVLAGASEDNPILLVLEDLHWAGRPTLQMLGHVARNVGPAPLMIVATFRDTDVSDRHPIASLVGELHRGQDVARLDLGGLDERAVSALVEGGVASQLDSARRIQLTKTLRMHTAGNPFFLVQVLSHLTENRSVDTGGLGSDLDHPDATDVPDVVRDAVAARLSRLSEAANSVLATASVVGSEFDLRILQHLASTSDSDQLLNGLDEAVTARLLLEAPAAPGRYSFAHALVRGTVYTGLTVGRRALLHRQVGEALEAFGRSSETTALPVLAYHFAQGAPTGSGNKAGTYALAAARQALSQLGFEEAASNVERGLRALETDGDQPDYGLRATLLLTLAEAKAHALDHPARKRAALLAAEAARAAGTAGDLAWAAFWYSARPVAGVRDDTGIDLCQEALAALAPDRLDLRAIVLAILASQRSFGGEGYAADQMSSEALALARKSGGTKALALALFARYDTLWGTERAAERVRLAEELLATDAVTHAVAWTDGRRLRALARLQLGDIEGCRADVENLDRVARERRSRYLRAVVAQWHGVLAMLEGRFAEVEETAAEIPTLAQEDQNLRNVFAAQMFHLRLEQGRLAEFQPLLRAFVEANPGMPGFAAALALTHAHLGHVDEAHRLFQGLAHCEFASIPQDLVWPATIGVLSEVCVRLTDSVRADVLYRLLRPFSGQLIVVATGSHCLGAADRYLGMLADVSGEPAESKTHFERAVALEERIGAPPLLARTQFWYARMLLRHGGPTDQETRNRLLLSARETTERLGMAQLLDDVRVAQR